MTNKERIAKAEQLYMDGYNCCQAVAAAFADLYGYTEEQALRTSAGFGGGIGGMHLTCGAACGMFTLAGMECGQTARHDAGAKQKSYQLVKALARRFTEDNGSMVCAELLRMKKGAALRYAASDMSAEYLKSRPCLNQVISAARIYAGHLEESAKGQ